MSLVTERLEHEKVPFEVLHHTETDTSVGEAIALGISPAEVIKTLGIKTGSRFVPAVILASQRLHMGLVRRALGDNHARLATEEELRERLPGFQLGALPPMASLFGAPAYVDPEVLDHEVLVFAAGDRTASVRMRTADLFREEEVNIAKLARGGADIQA